MHSGDDEPWRAGHRVFVRGDVWTIVEREAFTDCDALRLSGTGAANAGVARTILTPFDRPVRLQRRSAIRIVRPRRWLRALRGSAIDAHPFGGLSAGARSAIDLLPYQLEPALAMSRRGATRLLIADAVGLGKTIQAGLILNELAARHDAFRALVVTPAGLRDQWSRELATRFGVTATIAGAAWLAQIGRDIPLDVNPWVLPGIYVSSFDFIKQPEVLRPLEEAIWDAVVVDEAHAAAPGTARRAAVHAIAQRARRVILLTATPHAGDVEQFDALCRIGGTSGADDRPLLFRRSRSDVGIGGRRRSVLLSVRLSDAERRMHRLLEAYTARLCREARVRGDSRARLAAIILRKRALSSAASLAASSRRRLALLAGEPSIDPRQLSLPLSDEDPLEDGEPDSALAAPGLADASRERRWLAAIAEAAGVAARSESKTAFLLRLLSRMREPAIVFTEYRDTLERLRRGIAAAGHDIALLHGGLSPTERSAVQDCFNAGGTLLLATDAASEGLNLHGRCRTVIHYELPWSPSRLEQRTGRVDRIGQQRVVHEIVLIADDTAERLVLAPLARRAARARRSLMGSSRLMDVLTESRIANTVMDGTESDVEERSTTREALEPAVAAPADLRGEAEAEAARLKQHREWGAHAGRPLAPLSATVLRLNSRPRLARFIGIYTFTLVAGDGALAHQEIVALHAAGTLTNAPRTCAEARRAVQRFLEAWGPALRAAASRAVALHAGAVENNWALATDALAHRERAIAATVLSSDRPLVQAGLFDRRAITASLAQRRAADALRRAVNHELDSLTSARRLTSTLELSGVLIVTGRVER